MKNNLTSQNRSRPITEQSRLIEQFPNAQAFWETGSSQESSLLIHGFTGTPNEVLPVGKMLFQQLNWSTNGIMLSGHGSNVSEMIHVHHSQWISDVEKHGKKIFEEKGPFHVVGMSMGATLAILLAQKRPQWVKSLILLSPAIFLTNYWVDKAVSLLRFFPMELSRKMIIKGELEPKQISYGSYPLASVKQLSHIIQKAKHFLKENTLRIPVFVAISNKDQTTHPKSADMIASRVDHPMKKVMYLNSEGHLITLGSEAPQLIAEIKDFCKNVS